MRLLGLITFAATFALAACGGSGAPTTPSPVVNLSASPTIVNGGAAATLTWSSTNATSCTASGGWTGQQAASGTQSTAALTTNTTFTLSCTGAGGTSPSSSVTVNVVPTTTLTASPAAVASGASTTLTWTSTNATACTASGGWTGAQAVSGTFATAALSAETIFSLVCSGDGGSSSTASADVTVTPSPTAMLNAMPATVAAGATTTLTWSSTAATACSLSDGSNATAVAASGTQASAALSATTTFTLTCSGAGGSAMSAPVAVTVMSSPPPPPTSPPPTSPPPTSPPPTSPPQQVPMVSIAANPATVVSGGTSTLTWSSTNAPTSCAASGGWTGAQAGSGSIVTAALTATTTYTLICSNAGGAGPAASATVTVGPASTTALAPKVSALTLTRTQQFAATLPGATATWSVNDVVGGNATTGTVTSTGLYTAGSAPGQYTVTATSSSDATKSAKGTIAVTDLPGVYSYHNNQSRNGSNLQEYALTKANVASGFGKLASCAVDGAVYAQPLWVANVSIGGAPHNVLYAATEHDGLFAFDADPVNNTCVKLWSSNLIDVPHGANGGETTVPSGPAYHYVGVGAGDIQPEVGITGTPVIDPAAGILYVVTKSMSADKATFYQRLHAIDITTGNEKAGSPILITGTYTPAGGSTVTFNTQSHLQRAGLTFSNGSVYVAFTAHEDAPSPAAPWYGWLMSYQYANNQLTQNNVINVAPVSSKGGIWMSGGAPAVDASGNLYLLTGNGAFNVNTGGKDYGNSMLKLSPTLAIAGYYTPNSEPAQGIHDNDLGAGGAALLADLPAGNTVIHAMIFGGKESELFVIDRDNPGGYDQSGNSHVQAIAFGTSIFATGALWNNHFYLAGKGGPLKAYTLNTSTGTPQFTAAGQSSNTYGFPGATPSVAAAGTANGIAWTLDTGGKYCTNQSTGCVPVVLHAHDADAISTEIWDSANVGTDAAGYPIKFNVPTVANGHVYIGTRGNDCSQSCAAGVTPTVFGTVDVYGLKP